MKTIAFLLLVVLSLSSCSSKTNTNKDDANPSTSLKSNSYKIIKIVDFNGEKITLSSIDSSDNYLIEGRDFSGVVFHGKEKPFGDVFTFRMLLRPTKEENTEPFNPTYIEVLKAESILKRCTEIDKIGVDSLQIWPNAIDGLKTYRRQYFGGINSKGQKLIWINCFRKSEDEHWQTKQVVVQDGGKGYFNLVTNISTNECYGFFRNSIGG